MTPVSKAIHGLEEAVFSALSPQGSMEPVVDAALVLLARSCLALTAFQYLATTLSCSQAVVS